MLNSDFVSHALKGESLGELSKRFGVSRQRIWQKLHSEKIYDEWKQLRDSLKPRTSLPAQTVERICIACGNTLPFHKARYCCAECRVKDANRRQRERYQNDPAYKERVRVNHANWRQKKENSAESIDKS